MSSFLKHSHSELAQEHVQFSETVKMTLFWKHSHDNLQQECVQFSVTVTND